MRKTNVKRRVKKVPYKTRNKRRNIYKRKKRTNPEYAIFPRVKNVAFVYKHQSQLITSSGLGAWKSQSWRLNSLFDPDYDNNLGNKGPLFKDVLLTANGPYRNYRVNAWKVKISLINLSDKALNVYYDPASYAIAEADTPTEMQNRRGVKYRLVTAQANSKPICVFNDYMKLTDFAPDVISSSENYSAAYNADPSSIIYGNILWGTVDGSLTAFSVALQIEYTAYATLYNADSQASV